MHGAHGSKHSEKFIVKDLVCIKQRRRENITFLQAEASNEIFHRYLTGFGSAGTLNEPQEVNSNYLSSSITSRNLKKLETYKNLNKIMSLGLCYKLSEFSKHCQVKKIPKNKTKRYEKHAEAQ